MQAPGAPTAVSRAIQERLEADARRREQSIAQFMILLLVACAVLSLALGARIGWSFALTLAGIFTGLGAWYGGLRWALSRGHFHPLLTWLNVGLECTYPVLILTLDLRHHGPEYALTSPPIVIWGALVMLSSLRHSAALAWAAGALAAIEYVAFYWLLVRPQMPADVVVTLTAPFILIRAMLLFAFGPLSSIIAGYVVRRVKVAVEEVRANDLLGKYLLHERIGSGGMAEVFRATYSPAGGFEKAVAIKRVLPGYAEEPEFDALFRQEAALGSQLNHPNIVQVLDLVRDGQTLVLAMEFVDGGSLKAVLKALRQSGQSFPLRAATFVAAEVASALEYVHTKTGPDGRPLNLIHRDLNPPNLLLSRGGDVKLADFGIARAATNAVMTRSDQVRGKAAYMAPEQAMGQPIDGRVDLFALGLTLHEMLTGRRPLQGDGETALMRASVEQAIPSPSALRPEVPRGLDALVMQLLERNPARRLATGAQLREALLQLPEAAAPYPHGRAELAALVRSTLATTASAPQTPLLSQPVTRGAGRDTTDAAAPVDEATVTAAAAGPAPVSPPEPGSSAGARSPPSAGSASARRP